MESATASTDIAGSHGKQNPGAHDQPDPHPRLPRLDDHDQRLAKGEDSGSPAWHTPGKISTPKHCGSSRARPAASRIVSIRPTVLASHPLVQKREMVASHRRGEIREPLGPTQLLVLSPQNYRRRSRAARDRPNRRPAHDEIRTTRWPVALARTFLFGGA
ncbi:hypothetical protein [Streptomyces sp. NPDC001286]